jgi:uncharacterized protein YbaP (TraB family)
VVEVDVGTIDPQQAQRLTQSLGLYAEGTTLDAQLPPDLWAEVSSKAATIGLPAQALSRMRPWLTAITLTVLKMQSAGYSQDRGVDISFIERAKQEEKPIVALETMEGQLRAMADLPEDVQILLLQQTLLQLEDDDFVQELFEAWAHGDAEGLAELLFEDLVEHPELEPAYEALFFRRNRHMATRLDELLKEGKPLFVVVGAGHLVGPGSVVELLREAGYGVTQVHTEAPGSTQARAPSDRGVAAVPSPIFDF